LPLCLLSQEYKWTLLSSPAIELTLSRRNNFSYINKAEMCKTLKPRMISCFHLPKTTKINTTKSLNMTSNPNSCLIISALRTKKSPSPTINHSTIPSFSQINPNTNTMIKINHKHPQDKGKNQCKQSAICQTLKASPTFAPKTSFSTAKKLSPYQGTNPARQRPYLPFT
jgi:hypothetical protein